MSDEGARTSVQEFLGSLRTARSAAVGGVVFAIFFGAALTMYRIAFPYEAIINASNMPSSQTLALGRMALLLIPYAGIAFLWFIAAITYNLGAADHRLFTTVFLGSGLLFVALMFVAGAFGAAELSAFESGVNTQTVERLIAGLAVNELLVDYGARMAAVFIFALSSFGRVRKILPAWVTIISMLAGLFLLTVPFGLRYCELVFPIWVLFFSIYLFITHPGRKLLVLEKPEA